jgi:hypothetical protein
MFSFYSQSVGIPFCTSKLPPLDQRFLAIPFMSEYQIVRQSTSKRLMADQKRRQAWMGKCDTLTPIVPLAPPLLIVSSRWA